MNSDHSFIHIHSTAILNNFAVIKNGAPHSKILAMIKANAYGHGLVKIAQLLSQADGFGVACLAEAQKLREAGISQKIVLMRGAFNLAELTLAQRLDLDLVIHQAEQVDLLLQKTPNLKRLTLWIKINTGMNRLGFSPTEFRKVFLKLNNRYKNLILISHLASSEEIQNPKNLKQIQKFNMITRHRQYRGYKKSLVNSGGILNFPDIQSDWVRPGLMLYGVSPIPDKTGSDFNLKPVMTWQSQLIATKIAKKNETVGYNGIYACEENMPIGIVGVGYADGYPRHAQNGTPLLVNQQQVPLIGRVSMDMLAVDLRNAPSAKVGDPVILWGEGLPVEKVARFTASSAYELLCGLKSRG